MYVSTSFVRFTELQADAFRGAGLELTCFASGSQAPASSRWSRHLSLRSPHVSKIIVMYQNLISSYADYDVYMTSQAL